MEEELELEVGTKIKVGPLYADKYGFEDGEVIELVEGFFEDYNGLYTEMQSCPAVWDQDTKEFDSIYHLFGNNLEDFMDCQVINPIDSKD